jgi:hypothetical protein
MRVVPLLALLGSIASAGEFPQARSGAAVRYRIGSPPMKASVVAEFTLFYQAEWVSLLARKHGGGEFQFWLHR